MPLRVQQLMKSSVLTADIEQKHTLPPYQEGLNASRKKRQVSCWINLTHRFKLVNRKSYSFVSKWILKTYRCYLMIMDVNLKSWLLKSDFERIRCNWSLVSDLCSCVEWGRPYASLKPLLSQSCLSALYPCYILQQEKMNSKGKNWFDMKAPEMTEEQKNDLKILQMRHVLDPKAFYKRNDLKNLPKFFQVKTNLIVFFFCVKARVEFSGCPRLLRFR